MLKLIDRIFISELTVKPNLLHKIVTFFMVLILLYTAFHLFGIKKKEKIEKNTNAITSVLSSPCIYNNANLAFNEDEVKYINKVNSNFLASLEQPEIVIYTDTDTITDVNSQANKIFNEKGIGNAKHNNGILIYVNTNPSPKIRIEVGYGLEDVINDAKAGRIIDDNIKRINENKQLKEFDNKELSQLITYIFSDIAHIIAEKYIINIGLNIAAPEQSSVVSTMANKYIYDVKERLAVHYQLIIKEASEIYKYLFVIMIILFYFRALKYRYVYITFLLLSIIGYLAYAVLNGTWVTLLLSLLFLPLLLTAFPKVNYDYIYTENMHEYKMPHLMLFLKSIFYSPTFGHFQYIPYRFCLNIFIMYYLISLFLLLMLQKYGIENIYILCTIFIFIITSIIFLVRNKAARVIIPYGLYTAIFTALMVDSNMIFAMYLLIAAIVLVIYNLFVGFNILGMMSEANLEFSIKGIFYLLFFIVRIILMILSAGRIGGGSRGSGSSGGGGASR